MRKKAVEKDHEILVYNPDRYKTYDICNKAVLEDPIDVEVWS